MQYAHEIDGLILDALFRHGDLSFTKIFTIVKKDYLRLSKRILSRHLYVMARQEIIAREEFQAGKARICSLTRNTKKSMMFGNIITVRSKREEGPAGIRAKKYYQRLRENKERSQIYKRTCVLLFLLAAAGSYRFRSRVQTKEHSNEDQDIPFYEPSEREKREFEQWNNPYSVMIIPGASASDLLRKYRVVSSRGLFQHVMFEDRSQVQEILDELTVNDLHVVAPIQQVDWIKRKRNANSLRLLTSGETRYAIYDEDLQDFFIQTLVLYEEVMTLIRLMFIYSTMERLPEEIIRWHEFCHGKRNTNKFVKELEARRSDVVRSEKKRLTHKDVKERIRSLWMNLNAHYNLLTGDLSTLEDNIRTESNIHQTKRFGEIHKKYGNFTQWFLTTLYPEFVIQSLSRSSRKAISSSWKKTNNSPS